MLTKFIYPFVLILPAALHASGVALNSSANPAVFGRPVTLTATLTPATATGKVTFYDGTAVLETETLASGKAVFTTSLLLSGQRPLRAYYGGDANNPPSSSAVLLEQVNTVPGTGFKTEETYALSYLDPYLTAADVNGDGKADLIVAGDSSSPALGTVSILLVNGDGSFQPPVTYTFGTAPTSVALADFNGDGKMDMFIASAPGAITAATLLGNGDGTFQAPRTVTGLGSLGVVVVLAGDFNGDGKADVILAGQYEIEVALGNGDGTFQAPSIVYSLMTTPITALTTGDLNGDGKTDLAVGTGTGYNAATIAILIGNGDGTFESGETIGSLAAFPAVLSIADLNGDRKADLVALGGVSIGQEGQIGIYLGNGDGTFQPPIEYAGYGYASDIAIVDLNGDGKLDLAFDDNPVNVMLGNGDGTFQAPVLYPVPVPSFSVAAADFNGDGRADIAVAGLYSLTILTAAAYSATSTELGSAPNPSTHGQLVTLTAQVSPSTATGAVQFFDGLTLLGAGTLSSGVASFSTAALSGGTHALTAVYGGDSFDASSTSAVLNQAVEPQPSSIELNSAPNPSIFQETVTLNATVSPSSATGAVRFYQGTTLLGRADISNGAAVFNVSNLPLGALTLMAVYAGDVSDQPSASPSHTQTVRDPTSIDLTSSANPSAAGQSIVLTAAVSPAAATGQVTFYAGGRSIGRKTLSGGKAAISISTLPAGKHELSVSYAGDGGHGPSESPVLIQAVNP